MFKLYKTLLLCLILLSLAGFVTTRVKAQAGEIQAEILPSEGSASTNITIRFKTTVLNVGNVDRADIFWDEVNMALNEQGILGADGSYNYQLQVPTEFPLSELGNHTIRVDSVVSNYGPANFNFTFTIIEFVPSPEYVSLNETYNSLLTNYTRLWSDYNQTLIAYSILLANYSTLNSVLMNFSSLTASYNTLVSDYNTLTSYLVASQNFTLTTYGGLNSAYTSLQGTYASLSSSYDALNSTYHALRNDYDSLNSSYHALRSNYDALTGDLTTSRNLVYVFAASTIALAVLSFYLFRRKVKQPGKTRY